MENRLIITVSDVHGSRQYSAPSNIKSIIYTLIAIFIALVVATVFYVLHLKNKTSQPIALLENNQTISKVCETNDSKVVVIRDDHVDKEDIVLSIKKAIMFMAIPNGRPIEYKKLSSPFGFRDHPITKKNEFHEGIDLTAPKGTAVYATASGIVKYAKTKGNYGKVILILNSYGFKTAYGHLSKYEVKRGDFINKGDIIGYVGDSGKTLDSHLHYEVRYLNKWLDPKAFMSLDLDNINYTTDKIDTVEWKSILKRIDKLSKVSSKIK
ncbi:MAG: M23 family metallopeptidase [Sulfurovum sp.]